MIDESWFKIETVLPLHASYGKTIGRISHETGLKSGVVRSRLRAAERSGKCHSILSVTGVRLWGLRP